MVTIFRSSNVAVRSDKDADLPTPSPRHRTYGSVQGGLGAGKLRKPPEGLLIGYSVLARAFSRPAGSERYGVKFADRPVAYRLLCPQTIPPIHPECERGGCGRYGILMILRPTTLILGAGASVHVGYPLGSQLISSICKKQNKDSKDLPSSISASAIEQFTTRLGRSGHYSIDAFLAESGSQMDVGKFLIARELKRVENLDLLFPPNRSGWYQYLFNKLVDGGLQGFRKNRLSILTFNYDRSLEAYLHTALMNRFSISENDALDFLSGICIIHLHGSLGAVPGVPYTPDVDANRLAEISQNIKIIHELDGSGDAFCSDEFSEAHELLKESERIFFLGFGFHHENLKRFRFFTPESSSDREIFSTTTGMQTLDRTRLVKDLESFGISETAFPNNSADCESFFARTAYLE